MNLMAGSCVDSFEHIMGVSCKTEQCPDVLSGEVTGCRHDRMQAAGTMAGRFSCASIEHDQPLSVQAFGEGVCLTRKMHAQSRYQPVWIVLDQTELQ